MSNKNFPSIEELLAFPKPLSVSISNDGQKIAYVERLTNWDDNIFQSNIFIYENGKTYPLTTGKVDISSPSWSSDSKTLAYLYKTNRRNDRNQIYIKKENDIAAIQVSHAPDGVRSFKWSQDGNGFFFIARETEPKNIKKRREIYGDIEYVDKESRCQCLFYIDLQKGINKTIDFFTLPKDLREKQDNADDKDKQQKDDVAIQLTQSKNLHISNFDISPLGDKIVFAAAPSPRVEDVEYSELYLLNIESQEIQKLNIPHSGRKGRILFSPDGTKICFTFDRDNKIYNNRLLGILNLETQTISYPQIAIDEDIYILQWIENGIFIDWRNKTNSCIGIVKEDGEISNLIKEEDCYIKSASISFDGQNISYIKASSKQYFEVYFKNHSNNIRITNYSHLLDDYLYARKQVIQWSSSDGTEIEGILSTPPDFNPELKYPLLIIVHGGPVSTSLAIPLGENLIYPIESFIKKGFIILQPNYRGSAGYGEAFRSLNYRNLGISDYEDVISGVDYLIAQGYVNPDKIGIMGWSQGGYISAFCSTYSNRFKAISVGAGISNWVTYYVATDINFFTQHYLGDTPWQDIEIYQKTSPMTYIKSACTPTLIQHGDRDKRVPVSNAYELYQGLQDMGVETELVILKNTAHSPYKPGMYRALMKQNLTWFCHYLLSEDFDGFYLLDKD